MQTEGPIERVLKVYDKISADEQITVPELDELSNAIIKNNMTDYPSLKKIIDALFRRAESTLSNPEDIKKVSCLQKVTDAIVEHFMDVKPQMIDALFFPSEESEQKLISYLNKAKKRLCVCVFTISNHHIARCLEGLHDKGVEIRIISDDGCLDNIGSDIKELSQKGIPVRTDSNLKAFMHNKFAVIDSKFLITGSFNWTTAAVRYNQENVMISDFNDVVQKYENEFERLWKQFEKNTV